MFCITCLCNFRVSYLFLKSFPIPMQLRHIDTASKILSVEIKGKQTLQLTMDAIKGRIEDTAKSLEDKRSVLLHHKQQYIDLKFKLLDFAQYDESDTLETDIKLNSKAIVKGQIINPNKILAFLGCEYFVERNPQEAVKVVENKLKFLNQAISEFDIKIKEARKTLENIDELEKYEKEDSKKKQKKTGSVEDVSDDVSSPLQFMDIREELDDDGNVISSTVKPQTEKGLDFGDKLKFEEQNIDNILKGPSNELNAGPEAEPEESNDELEELLRDMEIRPIQKIEEIVEISEDADTKDDDSRDGADEFSNLMEEFGISESTAVTDTKKNSNEVEKEFPASDTQNSGLLQIDDFKEYHPTRPAIEPEDIMQLQLISDEIDRDEEYSDYEYDENDQEDETAEEDTDWDFVTDGDALVPSSHRGLFVKELTKFRNRERNAPVDNQDKPVKEKMRKSVSFAPNLEIKEVENISDELKKDVKLSKFKQRHAGGRSNNFETNEVAAEVVERPVSDIVEREVSLETPRTQLSKIIPTNTVHAPEFEPYAQLVGDIDYDSIKAYVANDEDEEEVLNQQVNLDFEGDDEDEDEGEDEDEDKNVLADKIIENDQVEDPSYFVDENLLKREYQILRNKMINKYAPPTTKKSVLISKPPEGQEIEPIDQNGNPIKVSRFRASRGKR